MKLYAAINYILVPSSAKSFLTQMSVIAKLDGRKYFILRGFILIPSIPTRSYLFKVSICKHISNFFLFTDFEQENVYWGNVDKVNTFEDKDPAGIYLFKVNNGNTRTMCEICTKLTIKSPMTSFWCLYR